MLFYSFQATSSGLRLVIAKVNPSSLARKILYALREQLYARASNWISTVTLGHAGCP